MAKPVAPEPEDRSRPETAGDASKGPTEHRPPPHSGARPIQVPQPHEILRPGFEPAEPDRALDTEDRGGRERSRRWRTGRPEPAEEERPDAD